MDHREKLGQIVRETWIEKAQELPNPKPSNLLPWETLDEWNKEVDRCIGEQVESYVLDQLTSESMNDFTHQHVEGYIEWVVDAISFVPMNEQAKIVVDTLIAQSQKRKD